MIQLISWTCTWNYGCNLQKLKLCIKSGIDHFLNTVIITTNSSCLVIIHTQKSDGACSSGQVKSQAHIRFADLLGWDMFQLPPSLFSHESNASQMSHADWLDRLTAGWENGGERQREKTERKEKKRKKLQNTCQISLLVCHSFYQCHTVLSVLAQYKWDTNTIMKIFDIRW